MAELTAEQRALVDLWRRDFHGDDEQKARKMKARLRAAGFAIIPLEPDEAAIERLAQAIYEGRKYADEAVSWERIAEVFNIDYQDDYRVMARAAYSTIAGGADG